jgi:DNA-binding winged helix-turn-helix (wHTH) protein
LAHSVKNTLEGTPLTLKGFVFDPTRGILLGPDGQEVPLRPKAFSLFQYLVVNAGRVVNRQELLDAIWPGVFVSDDSITQCVGEIRRALGPDNVSVLRTIPRRGYIFDAPVLPPAPEPARPPPVPADLAPPRTRSRWLARPAIAASFLAVASLVIILGPARDEGPPAVAAISSGPLTPQQEEARRLCQEGRIIFNGHIQPDGWLAARALQERAIEADPSFPNAYAEATFTYTNMVSSGQSVDPAADLAHAEALAHRAVALGPDLGVVHFALGAVLRNQRRPAEALASYRKAVALDRQQLPALANVGFMLILLGTRAHRDRDRRPAQWLHDDAMAVHPWPRQAAAPHRRHGRRGFPPLTGTSRLRIGAG